jgi:hypothetical protein
MTATEFSHSFTDKEGNTLAYLYISSPEEGRSGKVTLQLSEKKSPGQYKEAIEECRHFAEMLNIKYAVDDNSRTVTFNTGDEFSIALVLTRDLEDKGIVGPGAHASLEHALSEAKYISCEQNPVELAVRQAQQIIGGKPFECIETSEPQHSSLALPHLHKPTIMIT